MPRAKKPSTKYLDSQERDSKKLGLVNIYRERVRGEEYILGMIGVAMDAPLPRFDMTKEPREIDVGGKNLRKINAETFEKTRRVQNCGSKKLNVYYKNIHAGYNMESQHHFFCKTMSMCITSCTRSRGWNYSRLNFACEFSEHHW